MPGTPIDRVGIFHARPMEWSLQNSPRADSKAKNVNIRYEILDQGCKNEAGEMVWSEQWPSGVEVYGRHWVIGKDGSMLQDAIARAIRSLGWSGKFQDLGLSPQEAKLRDCRIEVEQVEYEGKKRFQVKWLNPYNWEGSGGMQGEDNASLLALDNERGGEMRAIIGTIAEEDKTAEAAEPKTVAPKAGPPPPPSGDDIPFE